MSRRIINLLVLFLVVGMFVFMGYSFAKKGDYTDVGDKAYNFELPNLDESDTKLSDFEGEIIVINFFATWCKPCVDEAPELEAFGKNYGDQYKLIMINKGETKDRVKKFINKYPTPAVYLFDYNAKVAKKYNALKQPETFVIDRQGIIREHYNGPVTEMQLYNMVKKYD